MAARGPYDKILHTSCVLVEVPVKKSLTLVVMEKTTRYIAHLKEGDSEPLDYHQVAKLAKTRGMALDIVKKTTRYNARTIRDYV